MASSFSGKSATCQFLEAAVCGILQLLETGNEFDIGEGLTITVEGIKDKKGLNALHFAADQGKTHVCKYLIAEVKLGVNVKDGEGHTPLHHAILGEHHPTAIYLLENGANPNAATDHSFTPLHYSSQKGFKKLISLLISKGAEVDAMAKSGTPLQKAAACGKKEAVKILLENHANPNIIHILSPLVVSILGQSFECVKLLLEKGLMPIEIAASIGYYEGVTILFPLTARIPTIPDWSFQGIMNYVYSEEAVEQRRRKVKETFLQSKSKGEEAVKRKDYFDAIYWHLEAIYSDPSDAAVLSNRSLC